MSNQELPHLWSLRSLVHAGAFGTSMLLAQAASAALETRTWVGGTSSDWNTHANWSPASAPLASDRIAVFDSAPAFQPSIYTNVTVIAGIWMTGSSAADITITSNPSGQNGGNVTFQTNANTINGHADAGVLIDNTSSGALTISTTAFKVGNSQSWINSSPNLFTLTSPMNLNGKTLTITGSGPTVFSNAVTNSTGTGALTKSGTGTFTLSTATHTYNGTTTVDGGALLVDGVLSSSQAVVTVHGGILGGGGTISRATTVHGGGTIAPGASGASAAILNVDHSLTLNGVAAFDLLSPTSYDALEVNASNNSGRSLTFGGTLRVTSQPGMSFAAGQSFDLFDWGDKTTVRGTFSSIELPELSGGLSWEMYDGQQLDYTTGTISVVPEPFGAGMLALAAAGAVLRRPRRARHRGS